MATSGTTGRNAGTICRQVKVVNSANGLICSATRAGTLRHGYRRQRRLHPRRAQDGRPAWFSIGYIDLPALVGIVAVSFPMARVGARLAHTLPAKRLKRACGDFLALPASKMLHGVLT